MVNDSKILITGGTGSLGHKLVEILCKNFKPKKVIIYSRDEYKQFKMQQQYVSEEYGCLRYFIGDVRDVRRLKEAMGGVNYVIHAAALKQIPAIEYNPSEAVRTNIDGSLNVIEACKEMGVERAILISTDKAVEPVNLYGATKLAAEKLFLASNSFNKTKFSVVRYGNVLASRGSVIETYLELKKKGIKEFPITDVNMTRFWITLEQAVNLVLSALKSSETGIFIAKLPSMKIVDIAKTIEPDCTFKIEGIRSGEKMHEQLVGRGDKKVFVCSFEGVNPLSDNSYQKSSGDNNFFLTPERFLSMLEKI